MLATCADLEDVFGGRARRVSGADEGRVEARDVGPALAPRLDERHCLHQRMSAIWAPFSSGAQPTACWAWDWEGFGKWEWQNERQEISTTLYLGMCRVLNLFCNLAAQPILPNFNLPKQKQGRQWNNQIQTRCMYIFIYLDSCKRACPAGS